MEYLAMFVFYFSMLSFIFGFPWGLYETFLVIFCYISSFLAFLLPSDS